MKKIFIFSLVFLGLCSCSDNDNSTSNDSVKVDTVEKVKLPDEVEFYCSHV